MADCSSIDRLVTPYVDGELSDVDRTNVDTHLEACPLCRARVAAEQTMRDLVHARRAAFEPARAPEALRARVARLTGEVDDLSVGIQHPAARTSHPAPSTLHLAPHLAPRTPHPAPVPVTLVQRALPLALAATLVLVVGAAFLYQLTFSSVRVMAAELAADHVKCFALNAVLGTHESAGTVERSLASSFGWNARLPTADGTDLELVGSRPCLYGEGRIAHVMYKHDGRPVSLFMLPGTSRTSEMVRVLGHEAAIWCVGNRTFVLIARETPSKVQQMASVVRAALQ